MSGLPTAVACAGCDFRAAPDEPYPFRCPRATPGDDVDHVMTRTLDAGALEFPGGEEANPFVRYRQLFHSYHLARAHGMSDAEYVELVEELDKAVADVDGGGFTVTPFGRADRLSERLGFTAEGGVWVKDETGNVSGSHKGRHLMGLMLLLRVVEGVGLAGDAASGVPDLAIASCGNAALAAAVVARAADRRLRVFVPPWAEAPILKRLERLEAFITTCPREEGVPGDPAYRGLQDALRGGAIPFTVQGSDNGLTVEGGETLGYEIVSDLAAAGGGLDRLFVQVGGGALASATIRAFDEAAALGVPVGLPRFHTVQTEGGWPLKRAYDRLAERILARIDAGEAREADRERADLMAAHPDVVDEELRYARAHRSEFMWPWETEPRSIATGILDDETYDWAAVVSGMLRTGGYPLVASEEALREANDLGREATGIGADHTGTAGLAALLAMRRDEDVGAQERAAVLFTGAIR